MAEELLASSVVVRRGHGSSADQCGMFLLTRPEYHGKRPHKRMRSGEILEVGRENRLQDTLNFPLGSNPHDFREILLGELTLESHM